MNMSNIAEPIDTLHARCLAIREFMMREFAAVSEDVARWEPRPCPQEQPKRRSRG